jgi:hypothetical protein
MEGLMLLYNSFCTTTTALAAVAVVWDGGGGRGAILSFLFFGRKMSVKAAAVSPHGLPGTFSKGKCNEDIFVVNAT